jgi:signal transduction histidine kinase
MLSAMRRYVGPIAASAGVLVATLLLAGFLEEREQTLIRHATANFARAVQTDIEEDLETRILSPMRRAALWDVASPSGHWREMAGAFLREYPVFRTVGWMGAGGERRLFPEGVAPVLGVPLDELLRRVATPSSHERQGVREAIFLPAMPQPDRTRLRPVVVPVFHGEQLAGLGMATFSEAEVVDSLLQNLRGLGYSIAVEEDRQPADASQAGLDNASEIWGHEAEARVGGVTWRARVWPSPELLHEMRSRVWQTVGALGFALALFAGLASYFQARIHERTVQLTAANERLKDLSGRLMQLQDEERRHLARELHEGTAQMLAALAMHLGFARKLASPWQRKVRNAIEASLELARESAGEVQAMAYTLHPLLLEDCGVAEALQWYAREFSRRSGIEVFVNVPSSIDRAEGMLELTIFRIVQEALTNILEHSGSKTAEISLRREASEMVLEVSDKGGGIPPDVLSGLASGSSVPGIGIAGMRERVRRLGGTLDIASDAQGTRLVARLPAKHRPATPPSEDPETPVPSGS